MHHANTFITRSFGFVVTCIKCDWNFVRAKFSHGTEVVVKRSDASTVDCNRASHSVSQMHAHPIETGTVDCLPFVFVDVISQFNVELRGTVHSHVHPQRGAEDVVTNG